MCVSECVVMCACVCTVQEDAFDGKNTVEVVCHCEGLLFLCVWGLMCALALVCTDLFSSFFLSLSRALSVLQVFWGHCINALIHSIILFWFPLKMLEHGK